MPTLQNGGIVNYCTRVRQLLRIALRWTGVLTIVLGSLAGRAARPADDPETIFRSVAQAARIGKPPPAPAGVRDLPWAELSPRGWDARTTLRHWTRFQTPHMAEDDPRIPKVAAGIRQEWDRAPTVRPPGSTVRLVAFANPIDHRPAASTVEVILTPFLPDGIEAPAPPANQMVVATLGRQWPTGTQRYPVWVTGTLVLQPTTTRLGRVAYRMKGATWEPYPYQQYPLPQYQWPH